MKLHGEPSRVMILRVRQHVWSVDGLSASGVASPRYLSTHMSDLGRPSIKKKLKPYMITKHVLIGAYVMQYKQTKSVNCDVHMRHLSSLK